MMGMIGFTVGLIGFVLHQLIEQISEFKWDTVHDILKVSKVTSGLGGVDGVGLLYKVCVWRQICGVDS